MLFYIHEILNLISWEGHCELSLHLHSFSVSFTFLGFVSWNSLTLTACFFAPIPWKVVLGIKSDYSSNKTPYLYLPANSRASGMFHTQLL